MKTLFKTTSLVFGTVLAIGCVTDDDGTGGEGEGGTADTSAGTTLTTSTSTTMTTAATDSADTGMTDTADTTMGTAGSDSGSSTTVDPNEFIFLPNPPEDYVQVDRMGMPAVNTALNLNVATLPMDHKDAYNAANPVEDAAATFFPNIVDSLDTLHLGSPTQAEQTLNNTGLDDDLLGLTPPLIPCIPPQSPADDCIVQGGPLVIPDVLAIDTEGTAGFPNGRLLTDPVIDITLAVIMLDISGPMSGQITAFVDLMLSQAGNDGTTTAEFPYLAPAWAP